MLKESEFHKIVLGVSWRVIIVKIVDWESSALSLENKAK